MFDNINKEEFARALQAQAKESGKDLPTDIDELFDIFLQHKDDVFVLARREKFLELMRSQDKDGVFLLWANFDADSKPFEQDSEFNHLTGIKEPGVVFAFDVASGKATLFVPQFEDNRSQWVNGLTLVPDEESARSVAVNEIIYLGKPQKGYLASPVAPIECYENLIAFVKEVVGSGRKIYTYTPDIHSANVIPQFMMSRLCQEIDGLQNSIEDVTSDLTSVRHHKDEQEVSNIFDAVHSTGIALCTVLDGIATKEVENEKLIQGAFEGFVISNGDTLAFPTIIASGKNATVLHYVDNDSDIDDNDLIVIDCGAKHNGYCADITRTIPISGTFTDRQKELYQIVLDTQKYIAGIACPGYWLNNKDNPEKSLQHLAIEFLQERGYADYFVHGIGHHLGLDVHDLSDMSVALKKGDVFTIEPGIYIKDEGVGIRIEDDYVMRKDGAECLSLPIPKEIADIEALVQGTFNFEEFVSRVAQ